MTWVCPRTGRSDPETGLIYLRNRYYDPTTAQFITPDPPFAITGSRYGYAGNDPINNDDPNGLSWYNPCVGTTCASDVAKKVAHAGVSDSVCKRSVVAVI